MVAAAIRAHLGTTTKSARKRSAAVCGAPAAAARRGHAFWDHSATLGIRTCCGWSFGHSRGPVVVPRCALIAPQGNCALAPALASTHHPAFRMLTISGLTKAFGGRTLFTGVSLQVNRQDRIGLVGPNGAGKTTLFSLILRAESPDAGEITLERNARLGYLPQETAPVGDETVLELASALSPEFVRLRRQVLAWDAGHPGEAEFHDNAHDRFNELGGYQLDARAKKILAGLSFRESDFNRPAREMSGGWVMRAHLARLLVQEPDLLMLDEPTNHLDLEALLWFQDYLKNYPGAILMISHDREFLNQLVGSIVEIRLGKLVRYRGHYDAYLVQREANEAQLLAAYKNQQREIAHLMEFVDRFRAKNTKAAQAKSKEKQIERLEDVAVEEPWEDLKKINF